MESKTAYGLTSAVAVGHAFVLGGLIRHSYPLSLVI